MSTPIEDAMQRARAYPADHWVHRLATEIDTLKAQLAEARRVAKLERYLRETLEVFDAEIRMRGHRHKPSAPSLWARLRGWFVRSPLYHWTPAHRPGKLPRSS